MAEDLISSLYPPPPPFYNYFTTENIERYEELKGAKDDQDIEPEGELKFLKPPTPPSGEHYKGYGNLWSFEDKLPKLSDIGWEQLYKEDDDELDSSKKKIQELHKLMKSLLLNFVELIGIMSINPSEFNQKVEDLKLILININHILNSYRPHQSRESLIMLIKGRIDSKRRDIENINTKMDEIRTNLKQLVNYEPIKLSEDTKTEENHDENKRDKIVYKLLTENI